MGRFAVLWLAILGGCGVETTRSLDAYDIVSKDDNFISTPNRLEGNGSVRFSDQLATAAGSGGFNVSFRLDDGGSLVIHLFADDALDSGLNWTITRSDDIVSGEMAAGSSTLDTTSSLEDIDATGLIRLYIDVHNDSTPARLIAWTLNSSNTDDAILNTDDSSQGPAPGRGTDRYWGLTLSDARVEAATQVDPRTE